MEKDINEIIKIDDSIKDLTTEKYNDLIDKDNKFMQIFTRAADPDANALIEFHTIDEKKLALIAEKMPEINRATRSFGKQNSQVTAKLMSLQMISHSPYRVIKQILAKIERKRGALKENILKLRKEKIKLDRFIVKRDDLREKIKEDLNDQDVYFDLQEVMIDIEEKVSNVSDSSIYIEAALKEILMYQKSYEEIKESNNIPDNWDEKNVEEEEVKDHIVTAFLHLTRDLSMTGRINIGTAEYLYQYGINPDVAIRLTNKYLSEISLLMDGDKYPSIQVLYDFLDKMYESFKDSYKHAMKRVGLKKLIHEDCLYLENKEKKEGEE